MRQWEKRPLGYSTPPPAVIRHIADAEPSLPQCRQRPNCPRTTSSEFLRAPGRKQSLTR